MLLNQIKWRKKCLSRVKNNGEWKRKKYKHILPCNETVLNFLPEIRDGLFCYIKKNNIKPHTAINNLLSSWALCRYA